MGAPADPSKLRAGLLRPEAGAEPLEDPDGLFEGLARHALVLRSALHGPEREERPRELEGVHSLRRLRHEAASSERSPARDRPVRRGEVRGSGGRAGGEPCHRSRALIELREQPLRLAKVADRKQSLDRSRARQLGGYPSISRHRGRGARPVASSRRHRRRRARSTRECNPQAKGGHSEPGSLDDLEQLGDLSAHSLGLTSIGGDLGKNRQAERLEHLQADLAGELHRLVAQLRGRVPRARRHLHLGAKEHAPDNVWIAAPVASAVSALHRLRDSLWRSDRRAGVRA